MATESLAARATEADGLPTEDDVRAYEARGWHVTPPILESGLLDRVRVAIEAHQRGDRDHPLPSSGARYSDWTPGKDDGALRNNEFCSLQSEGVRELVMLPILGEIAARLARSPAIRLFDDQAIHKPGTADASSGRGARSAVGWHTDGAYWSTCTSERMLTAWIPLQDVGVENGTLCVIDGSHDWPEAVDQRGFNDPDLGAISARIGRAIPDAIITPLALRKGQVSFHHMRTLHGSTPNVSAGPRFAVAVHVQDADNRHRMFQTPQGQRIVLPHDQLCRPGPDGQPDYRDPRVFPQIWPTEGAGTGAPAGRG